LPVFPEDDIVIGPKHTKTHGFLKYPVTEAIIEEPEDFWRRYTGVAAGEDRALGMDYRTSISTSSIQKIHDMGQISYFAGEKTLF